LTDAVRARRLAAAAVRALERSRVWIDDPNVYPAPDGDTAGVVDAGGAGLVEVGLAVAARPETGHRALSSCSCTRPSRCARPGGYTDDRRARADAAASVAGSLPIVRNATGVWLMHEVNGSWQRHTPFRLGR
jgi:hypothetical protein